MRSAVHGKNMLYKTVTFLLLTVRIFTAIFLKDATFSLAAWFTYGQGKAVANQ